MGLAQMLKLVRGEFESSVSVLVTLTDRTVSKSKATWCLWPFFFFLSLSLYQLIDLPRYPHIYIYIYHLSLVYPAYYMLLHVTTISTTRWMGLCRTSGFGCQRGGVETGFGV